MSKYYTPSLEELYVGCEVERRLFTEYDTEICCPCADCCDHHNLDDTWHWVKHILTQKDLEELKAYTGDLRTGKGIPVSGFYRKQI